MTAPRGTGARLSALHAASFASVGIYTAFFPVWLSSRALSPGLIGIVMAVPILVRIVATAPLLTLADRMGGPRRLLIASHLGQMLGYPLLLMLESGVAIAALVGLIAVAQAAIIPGNDLVTTTIVRQRPRLHYGRIRVWGSIAFLLATILAGYLVETAGPSAVILSLSAAPAFGILATHLALPREGGAGAASDRRSPGGEMRLPADLWLIIAAVAIVQSSHGAIYAFGSIHWQAVGFADATIGYLWAAGVVAEIALFVVVGQVVGRGSPGLGFLLLGSAAVMVRFAGMSLDPGTAPTFALQVLHGLTFGATHLGAMAALTAMAPEGARGRAQGLLAACSALAMAVVTIASGPIYRASGPMVFAAMAPLGLFGFCLTLAVLRRRGAQPQSAGEAG
jgi:PPP family 3-phenylpropionic acid transporter